MRTSALLLLATTPLLAQTSKTPVHKSAASSTAHHTATHTPTAAAHHTGCQFPAPELSAKIPSLPVDVQKCPTAEYSLTYIDTRIGTGELAQPRHWYTVRYTGYLPDGTKFDSSYDHPGGEPISFPYGAHQVIAGWDTGFEGMHIGGKRRLFVPYQLAYGEMGRPPVIPPKTMLIFDVELVSESATRPEAPRPAATSPAGSVNPAGAAPSGSTGSAAPAGQTPAGQAPAGQAPGTSAPAPKPETSPAGTVSPPPVSSTTPATSTQPAQPSTTPEPKK